MKIVILGAGALGSLVGALLARAGNDVTMIARGARLLAIRERGITVTGLHPFNVLVGAAENAGGLGEVDLLLVAVKTRDTLPALERVAGLSVATVASLQNGVLKEEQLAAAFGVSRVIGAVTIVGANSVAPAEAEFTMEGATYVGELSGGGSPRVREVVAAFSAAGLATEVAQDIKSVEWSKLCQVTPAMTLSALTRLEYHKVCLDHGLAALFVRITKECAAVAHGCGVAVGDYANFEIKTLAEAPLDEAVAMIRRRGEGMERRGQVNVRISMLQDVLAGRKTEIEETAGYVVAHARRHNLAVPTTEVAYTLVRGIDSYLA